MTVESGARRQAVLLMAYGTPGHLSDMTAYLTDIQGGRTPRPELVAELTARYQAIGGLSPLLEITQATAAGLRELLRARSGGEVEVVVGMKHWQPRIGQALRGLEGVESVVALVLAPHYSAMSVGGYRRQIEAALAELDTAPELVFIDSWHKHAPYLEALTARIASGRAAFPKPEAVHSVFTAHSLPARILESGDPYRDQLLETSSLLAERLGLRSWSFSFQSASRTGVPWLGPDLLETLDRLVGEGVSEVLVTPIGFVSDHLEVLFDIDVEAAAHATGLGMDLRRTPSLNAAPDLVAALADLVEPHLRRVVNQQGI